MLLSENPLGDAAAPPNTPIYSVTGQWIAFVTPDNRVWRPDSCLLGHLVNCDLFSVSGSYLGTVSNGVLSRISERTMLVQSLPDTPVTVPGYPGIPQPTLIRPLAPGETLEQKISVL